MEYCLGLKTRVPEEIEAPSWQNRPHLLAASRSDALSEENILENATAARAVVCKKNKYKCG
jgi:hypothetical protein